MRAQVETPVQAVQGPCRARVGDYGAVELTDSLPVIQRWLRRQQMSEEDGDEDDVAFAAAAVVVAAVVVDASELG